MNDKRCFTCGVPFLCLKTNASSNMILISKRRSGVNKYDIPKKLKRVLDIEIENDAESYTNGVICRPCLNKLEKFEKFLDEFYIFKKHFQSLPRCTKSDPSSYCPSEKENTLASTEASTKKNDAQELMSSALVALNSNNSNISSNHISGCNGASKDIKLEPMSPCDSDDESDDSYYPEPGDPDASIRDNNVLTALKTEPITPVDASNKCLPGLREVARQENTPMEDSTSSHTASEDVPGKLVIDVDSSHNPSKGQTTPVDSPVKIPVKVVPYLSQEHGSTTEHIENNRPTQYPPGPSRISHMDIQNGKHKGPMKMISLEGYPNQMMIYVPQQSTTNGPIRNGHTTPSIHPYAAKKGQSLRSPAMQFNGPITTNGRMPTLTQMSYANTSHIQSTAHASGQQNIVDRNIDSRMSLPNGTNNADVIRMLNMKNHRPVCSSRQSSSLQSPVDNQCKPVHTSPPDVATREAMHRFTHALGLSVSGGTVDSGPVDLSYGHYNTVIPAPVSDQNVSRTVSNDKDAMCDSSYVNHDDTPDSTIIQKKRKQTIMTAIRPMERQPMKEWLREQINSGDIPGLQWIDKDVFQIPWKHAARTNWEMASDALLFKRYAILTGIYKPEDPYTCTNHRRWKQNFRCAINSLPEFQEVSEQYGAKKSGEKAFKCYKFLTSEEAKQRREEKALKVKKQYQQLQIPPGIPVSFNT